MPEPRITGSAPARRRPSAAYVEALARGEREHGDRFDPSDLVPSFAPYYGTGERVAVRFDWGDGSEVLTGTIGKTTGWKPSFLLMRRSSDHGSPWVIGHKERIIAEKRSPRGSYLHVEPEAVHTSCDVCGTDIEGWTDGGRWRDRGNNAGTDSHMHRPYVERTQP